MKNLFGADFELKLNSLSAEEITKKLNNESEEELDVNKMLKSKKLSLKDRLLIITNRVFTVLGRYRNNIIVIKDKQTFENYISKAIDLQIISVDTETDNSLDPVTANIMGLCLYVPGEKAAYIPINHRDPDTKKRLDWQLTEEDCKEQLQRIIQAKTPNIIMHNGKFDYEVLKCTCNVKVPPTWDTMICAQLLNENELASLKAQYIAKIDPEQEKYDIDKLFTNVLYADVDPDIFALYAAQDAFMTYKLYELQKVELDKPEYGPHMDLANKHQLKGLRWLFHELEMPIVTITAEMELTGVKIDTALGQRLKDKYENQLAEIDSKISNYLVQLSDIIKDWKLSTDANTPTRMYVAKKTKMSQSKIEKMYPLVDENGDHYKLGKAKIEQLDDPINLDAPSQLAILFYDILKVPAVSKSKARGTGKSELELIAKKLEEFATKEQELSAEESADQFEADLQENNYSDTTQDIEKIEVDTDLDNESIEMADQTDSETDSERIEADIHAKQYLQYHCAADLCNLLLKRRGIVKLITTYIDVIPILAKHWPDGRIRFHMRSMGTNTGRYASGGKIKYIENGEPVVVSGINVQNIPSHVPEVRLLFQADLIAKLVEAKDAEPFIVPEFSEVETNNGWKYCDELNTGDLILVNGKPARLISKHYAPDSLTWQLTIE